MQCYKSQAHTLKQTHKEKGRVSITRSMEKDVRSQPQTPIPPSSSSAQWSGYLLVRDAHYNLDLGKGNSRESRTVSRAHRKLIFSWPSGRWGWGAARCTPGRWGRAAWGPRPPARSHSASADVRLRALKHGLLSHCLNTHKLYKFSSTNLNLNLSLFIETGCCQKSI